MRFLRVFYYSMWVKFVKISSTLLVLLNTADFPPIRSVKKICSISTFCDHTLREGMTIPPFLEEAPEAAMKWEDWEVRLKLARS